MSSVRAAWFANVMCTSRSTATTPSCRPSRSWRRRSRSSPSRLNDSRRRTRMWSIVTARSPTSSRKRGVERLVEGAGLDPRCGAADPPQPRGDQRRDEQPDDHADRDRDQRRVHDLVLDDAELAEQLGTLRVRDDGAVLRRELERDHERLPAVDGPDVAVALERRPDRAAPVGDARERDAAGGARRHEGAAGREDVEREPPPLGDQRRRVGEDAAVERLRHGACRRDALADRELLGVGAQRGRGAVVEHLGDREGGDCRDGREGQPEPPAHAHPDAGHEHSIAARFDPRFACERTFTRI